MYDIMILYPGTFSYTALCFSLLLCQHSFCQQCLLLVTEKIIQYIRELMSAHELPTVYILIKKTYYIILCVLCTECSMLCMKHVQYGSSYNHTYVILCSATCNVQRGQFQKQRLNELVCQHQQRQQHSTTLLECQQSTSI